MHNEINREQYDNLKNLLSGRVISSNGQRVVKREQVRVVLFSNNGESTPVIKGLESVGYQVIEDSNNDRQPTPFRRVVMCKEQTDYLSSLRLSDNGFSEGGK